MSTAVRDPTNHEDVSLPLAALTGMLLAASLAPLGSTMIAVALPSIGRDVGADESALTQWLVSSYLIASIALQSPGGKIGLANWAPEGFIGQLFKTIGKHVPPPAGIESPALWGTRARLAELFETGSTSISAEPRHFVFRYRSPDHWLAVFKGTYGPVLKAFAALDEANELIRSDPASAARTMYTAEATAGFSEQELVEVLRDPAIKFTTTPENVEKYADFMRQIGSIEHEAASWRDLFFPEIHGAAGS